MSEVAKDDSKLVLKDTVAKVSLDVPFSRGSAARSTSKVFGPTKLKREASTSMSSESPSTTKCRRFTNAMD